MASRLERQRVLRQLNARLSSAPSRPGLVVEGEEGGLVVEGEKAALLLYRGTPSADDREVAMWLMPICPFSQASLKGVASPYQD